MSELSEQQDKAAEQHQKLLCHKYHHNGHYLGLVNDHANRYGDQRHLVGYRVKYLSQRGNLVQLAGEKAVEAVAQSRKAYHYSRHDIVLVDEEPNKGINQQEPQISYKVWNRDQVPRLKAPIVHLYHHFLNNIKSFEQKRSEHTAEHRAVVERGGVCAF